MKKKQPSSPEDVKPDLKHDTMEYTASTEGDDKLDSDDPNWEDDEITEDELDFIDDTVDAQAEALNSAETDRRADNEVIFDPEDIDEASDAEDLEGNND